MGSRHSFENQITSPARLTYQTVFHSRHDLFGCRVSDKSESLAEDMSVSLNHVALS